jgi:O-antigen/teichoic acid export membrane protein
VTAGRLESPGTRSSVGQSPDDPGRAESEEERDDRNLLELLQELRVASLGVQVLFGFLLALPFSARFARLDPQQRHLYLVVVLLSVLATAQLTAPVAYHRIVFRRHRKAQLLRAANVLALTGLATVGISICGAVLLISTVLVRGPAVALVLAATLAMFVGLWVVLPLAGGHRAPGGGFADPVPPGEGGGG